MRYFVVVLVFMGIIVGYLLGTHQQSGIAQKFDVASQNTTVALPATSTPKPRQTVTTSVPIDKVLDLHQKGLTSVPADIFNKTDIEELDLSHNNLSGSLPAEVRLLQNLKVLDLSNNNFTGVPAEVGQLRELQLLNLANNKITGLPLEIGNLSKLQVLDVSGNEYSAADLEQIKQKLPPKVLIKVR